MKLSITNNERWILHWIVVMIVIFTILHFDYILIIPFIPGYHGLSFCLGGLFWMTYYAIYRFIFYKPVELKDEYQSEEERIRRKQL